MNLLGPVLKTNSLISLFICLDVSLFHPSLTSFPSELLSLVFFSSVFLLFSPSCFILAQLSSFFLIQLFPPFTVSFSLFIIPSCFPPHCHFHLLPPPSLVLLQQNKADIVVCDGSCSKLNYHYPSDCHLDVLEILLGFILVEKACQCFHKHTMDCFNFAQLSLHSFETSLIKEMDRCLAVFPLMERAFITLHV